MSAAVRAHLRAFAFEELFIEELHWDRHPAPGRVQIEVPLDEGAYRLVPVAWKSGVVAYVCAPVDDAPLPSPAGRREIERVAARAAHEHIVIYVDAGRTRQVWRWTWKRDGGTARTSEHAYHASQSGEAMAQKLAPLIIDLGRDVGLLDVLGGINDGLRKERVTRRFFKGFEEEHRRFLGEIAGLEDAGGRAWYASLTLNRLMFVYFIQRKGFLDRDPNYLRTRLRRIGEAAAGPLAGARFHTFYRLFLRRLFHEGLSRRDRERSPELIELLGEVPYLNGGLFDLHELERAHRDIDIPDEAFDRLFAFFDSWDWHLDSRPLGDDRGINPDVLGYIFEKYINQKQMGAYYTREDITGYIARGTIIPRLFDDARAACPVAFAPDGYVWRLLRDNPGRYIHRAVAKGIELPLPPAIAAGLGDPAARAEWNAPASAAHGLTALGTDGRAVVTETWRECAARRAHCEAVRERLASGAVVGIDELITLNLDLAQFARDVLDSCEGADLLWAFFGAIRGIAVLDPTCGSGAFNFAALNVLEPLYEACLGRMRDFCAADDAGRHPKPSPGAPATSPYAHFREVLQEADRHPNQSYFILRTIIMRNLYGVDVMPEAVEICKLRLFLQLIARADAGVALEPLPDIDFNIRAGNTLVGFATLAEARAAVAPAGAFAMGAEALARIDAAAREGALQQREFQALQDSDAGTGAIGEAKARAAAALQALRLELDGHMARRDGIDPEDAASLAAWRSRCQPFHWFAEFHRTMDGGGFGAIIGNPPYIQLGEVRGYVPRGYRTLNTKNLYAPMIERSLTLGHPTGRLGFIVPVSSVATEGYASLQALLTTRKLHHSSYDDRPSRLFDGLEHIRLRGR